MTLRRFVIPLAVAVVLSGCGAPAQDHEPEPEDESAQKGSETAGGMASSGTRTVTGTGGPRSEGPIVRAPDAAGNGSGKAPKLPIAPVVVATFDSGVNPFHPCWRVNAPEGPHAVLHDLPAEARALRLAFGEDFHSSLKESQAAIDAIEDGVLYYVPGTRLLFYGVDGASQQLVDVQPHGAMASTQIACEDFAFGGNAFVVVCNESDHFPGSIPVLADWAASQPFIDIVHMNIQDIPQPQQVQAESQQAISDLVATGKGVILAAGNGVAGNLVNYPMELSQYTGPPGSLVVGAGDQDGWTVYSNINAHVLADGGATRAGAHDSFEEREFEGTSSASPRGTGFVAELLARLRAELNVTRHGTMDGVLVLATPAPSAGPLSDGALTFAELHEVIRKSADPQLGPSDLDGAAGPYYIPAVKDQSVSYKKAGYGKLTEATMDHALAVLLGLEPMPDRAAEDEQYAQSEALRAAYWDTL